MYTNKLFKSLSPQFYYFIYLNNTDPYYIHENLMQKSALNFILFFFPNCQKVALKQGCHFCYFNNKLLLFVTMLQKFVTF